MALTRVQKIQIEAVKEPEWYFSKNYEGCVLITDGVSGIYIKPEKLVIDPAKLRAHEGDLLNFDPEKIMYEAIRVEKTKTAMILDSKTALKFIGARGAECWVNMARLKGYDGGEVAYYLNQSLGTIIFVDRNVEEPVGFCMTMKVDDE